MHSANLDHCGSPEAHFASGVYRGSDEPMVNTRLELLTTWRIVQWSGRARRNPRYGPANKGVSDLPLDGSPIWSCDQREYMTDAVQGFLARASDSVPEVADTFFAQTEAVLMEEGYELVENA